MKDIETYEDLLNYLKTLTNEQLKQKAQVILPSPLEVQALGPILLAGTLDEIEIYGSRSSVDNKFHAEEIALVVDNNPFGTDGAIAYKLDLPKYRDNKDLSKLLKKNPVYGKDGKTDLKDQLNPKYNKKKICSKAEEAIINNRVKKAE